MVLCMDTWQAALAAEVRAERNALDMTQQNLAESSGLSKSTVVRIENGSRAADINQMTAIAEAFGIVPSVFLARVESRRSRRPTRPASEAAPEEPAIASAQHGRRTLG